MKNPLTKAPNDIENLSKFPKRIVLGEGYPWVNGNLPSEHKELTIRNNPVGGTSIALKWPVELWSATIPKYRIVLERVEWL